MDVKGEFISITHFINPQLFWYHIVDVRSESHQRIEHVEKELALKYQPPITNLTQKQIFKCGDLVIAWFLPRNKYLRCRVLQSEDYTEYIVWAIDHGFPYKATSQCIHRLAEENTWLRTPIQHIYRGGVANIVPAEKDYDFMTYKAIMMAKQKWCDRACTFLQKSIADAVYLSFDKHFTDDTQHAWGDLIFVDRKQKPFNVADLLKTLNVAIECEQKFRQVCSTFVWTKLLPHVNNNGELNVRQNLYVKHGSALMRTAADDKTKIISDNEEDAAASECTNAKQKVEDWCERNSRLLKSNNNATAMPSLTAAATEAEGHKNGANDATMFLERSTVSSIHDFDSSIALSPDAMLALDDSRDFFFPRCQIKTPSICSKSSHDGAKSAVSATGAARSKRMQSLIEHKRKLELKGTERKLDAAVSAEVQENMLAQVNALVDNLEQISLKPKQTIEQKPQMLSALNNFYANYVESPDDNKSNANKIEQLTPNYIGKLSMDMATSAMSAKRIERLKATRKGFTASGGGDATGQPTANKFKDEINRKRNEVNMIPAGYNLMHLNPRKGDADNCARKRDADSNESKDSFERDLNASNSSDGKNKLLDLLGTKGDCDVTHMDNQNFRHTRSHTDKYKNCGSCGDNDKHLLDATIPELDNTILEPSKVEAESQACKVATSVVLPRRKQLKPPSEQKDKIKKILQNAEFEKELGNTAILDLKTSLISDGSGESDLMKLNTTINSTTSTSTTGTTTTTDSENNRQKTSNKNALVMKRLAAKNRNSTAKSISSQHESPEKPNTKPIYTKETFHIDAGDAARVQSGGLSNKVLTHAGESVKLQLIENFNDVHFPQQEITDQMNYMQITKVYRIQAYGWTHILRGNSLCVVNPARSGKTWCYLPSICSLVCLRVQNARVADTYGPVGIIMVPSSTHAEQVSRHCERLLTKCNVSIATLFGVRNSAYAKMRLLNGCGILVTTPASLLRLLTEEDNFIDGNRLHHFVLDDVELMLSRSNRDFSAAVEAVLNLSKRCKKHALQLVATSREWKPMLLPLMRSACQPLLVMGDFLEAAVYSKTAITIKLSAVSKMQQITDFMKAHPSDDNRLIIFCITHEEAADIHDALVGEQFDCIVCSRNSSDAGLQLVNRWKCWPRGLIVVCVDDVFAEINVHNANNLIHYSMPESWTVFNNRFSAMAQSYTNFINADNATKIANDAPKPMSLILLDEHNSEQLPRLYDFLKKHNQLAKINPDILKVFENVKRQREVARINNNTTLCPYLLEFGDCDEARCLHRHTLNDNDVMKATDNILQSGELRLHILKVYSPTHYSARLLQHKAANTTTWNQVRESSMASVFATRLNLHYQMPDACVEQFPLAVNDLCVCKVDGIYQRALVVEVDNSKEAYVCVVTNVKVKLIDMGETKRMYSHELYVCAERFKDFPAQAVDVRLKGVVPFDNERTWDSMSTKSVDKWIRHDVAPDMCVQVKINFTFADTIWVNNVIVLKHLATVGHYTYHVNLRRSLFEKKLAVIVSDDTLNIQSIAIKLGLLQMNNSSSKEQLEEQVEEDWDNLSMKSATDEVYVPLMPTAEPDRNVLEQKDPVNSSPIIPLPPSCKTNAAAIDAAVVNDQWMQLPIRGMVKVQIADEAGNGNWSDLYLQCIKDEQQHDFERLQTLIQQHINNLKNTTNHMSATRNLDCDDLMLNCIVKHGAFYVRAKIVDIFGSDESKSIYWFFLCDYARFVEVTLADLYNDFFYPTTNEIVECMPYRVVHCHLAGIKLGKLQQKLQQKLTKDHLFAYAVREHTEVRVQNKLNIKSYDILLYECDDAHKFDTAVMVNTILVNDGHAEFDAETKHYLDLDITNDLIKFNENNENTASQQSAADAVKVVSFDELLLCFQKACELDAEMLQHQIERDDKERSVEQATKTKNEVLDEHNSSNTTPAKEQTIVDKSLDCGMPKQCTTNAQIESVHNEDRLPPLRALNKRPQTTWYQTDCIIIIMIYAPDVSEYYLKVTSDMLHFTAQVNGEEQALLLHLLGTVDPSYVSHEVRGLNVIVRMLKCVYMQWPRLLKQSTKFSWLKYDLNAMVSSEMDYYRPRQELFRNIERKEQTLPYNCYSDTDSDDEIEYFENYSPIINGDDIRDPTTDVY